MITMKDLKDMPKGHVFARGELIDSPQGINIMNSGQMLRWVACRGDIADWAIYCAPASWDYEEVKRVGDKVRDKTNIKNCVNVDDEVMGVYRR
jgi:hypothetical protein